jgi:uncharacterized protein involved in exopolysaccharide biosynthesis/Mrp family chromosome partitioning ATPase
LTPREIARIFFRHARKMALFFGVVVVLTLVVIALYPRSYLSQSKLFIQVGRETVALDPTATTGQTMLLQKTQVNEINSALDILTSDEVRRRVVEMVGAARILDDEPSGGDADSGAESRMTRMQNAKTQFWKWLDPVLMNLRLKDPASEVDLAMRRMGRGVRVWAPKESTIITVTYRAASPELAHDVVEAVTKAFLEQHLRLNHVEGSLEFFSEQSDSLHAQLTATQTELRDRKNEFQMASMAGKRAIFEDQIKDVELQLLTVERDLAYSEAKAADLTRAIAGLEPEIITSRVAGFANEARDGMREKLYELELQESKLRSSYQDNHPLLMQIRRQREQAEAILAALPDERTQTTSALNTNQRQLELQLMQAQADAKALRGRQEAAQTQLGQLHEELHALNDRELRIEELERTVGILEGKYRMHVEKLEQARVNDELGRGRITNVKLAQPATMTSKPAAPNKRLLMALGMIVATTGALGLAFLAETSDQTLRTTEQVERELGLPVILSFAKRRRRAASASSSAATNGQPHKPRGKCLPGSYQFLVRELLAANGSGKRRTRTVGVVSCDGSKLRSQVATTLAVKAANFGATPVLLIDADARRRRVARRFHVDDSPGWHEVLGGVADVESCVHRPNTGNLAVMAPGTTSAATLVAEPVHAGPGPMEEIKTDYGLVVVDLPLGREWESPSGSGSWLDEVVLVVEAQRTRIQTARRVKESLERSGVHVTGVVLANRREPIPGWLYRRL